MFFATAKKLSIDVERVNFPMFSAKFYKCKINNKYGHGKLRNGYIKIMGKYLVKSVGSLDRVHVTC